MSADEVQKLLRIHNDARAEVGVQPLTWSSQLAAHAQKWADHLVQTGAFEHNTGGYGENIAEASDVESAVQMWLSEKAAYRGEKIGSGHSETGHYTQMVWGKTQKIGCGKGSTPNFDIWVCNYDPAGNRLGHTPY